MSAPTDSNDTTAFWETHYGARPQVWSGRPNRALTEEAADLRPGTALDLGCGEGADAIWLAQRGWHVTAVDVSRTALDRGARAAAAAGVAERIDWQHLDLADAFAAGTYDLVTAQFLHSPLDLPRDAILQSAAAAVAPAGTLLVVGHAAPPPWAEHSHSHPHGTFPGPAETAAALGLDDGDWVLMTSEVRERQTTDPDGEAATVSDSVVKARRR